MEHLYSAEQLEKIINEALIYTCACPAQVAEMVCRLRHLHDYQQNCVARDSSDINAEVHHRISQATAEAHDILEACMQDILRIEGWDLETLKMPANLREMLNREVMK